MVQRLKKLYARRIVNVNVNIVLAGLLSLIPVIGVIHLIDWMGVRGHWTVSGITLVSDLFFDVLIYFFLHWWANHGGPSKHKTEELLHADLSYFKSVTLVQFERAALSPLLYVLMIGTQQLLMRRGVGTAWATAAAFLLAIGLTRVLHTIWMLEQERRARARLKTGPAAAAATTPPPAARPFPRLHTEEETRKAV